MTALHLDCTVEELSEKRERGDAFALLDVRTLEEIGIAKVDGATHIPMDEIEDRLGELDSWRNQEIVVMCHHGSRSAMIRGVLIEAGFANVRNLDGGIEAYAVRIDQSVARY